MPIYLFECPKCKETEEMILDFSYLNSLDKDSKARMYVCKCGKTVCRNNQVINFAGGINMNASSMGINQRTFNNKKGGPAGIVGNKVIGRTGI